MSPYELLLVSLSLQKIVDACFSAELENELHPTPAE